MNELSHADTNHAVSRETSAGSRKLHCTEKFFVANNYWSVQLLGHYSFPTHTHTLLDRT